LNILKAISANRRAHDVLYVFVEQIARVISTERCSVVRIWGEGEIAHVLASHEDESVSDHVLSLAKYPELRECLRTRDKVVIQNVAEHPLTRDCAAEMKAAGIGALLVLPIVLYDGEVGTLLLRAARRQGHFSLREVSFFEIVANAAANALERAQLFENVQQANERLERLAITDGLTGLYNRRHFREYFDAEIERALRYEIPMAVMLFDVDNFKYLNDTYGHLVGDNVLREIADRSIGSVRKTDFLARYGGEEFVIVMPQTDAHGAEKQAARLLTTISGRPFRLLPEDYRVTVSVGLTVLEPGQRGTAESLLKAADGALYQAKRAGKNRFVRATLEPDA
jgi:two-component system cell cycle response regulator